MASHTPTAAELIDQLLAALEALVALYDATRIAGMPELRQITEARAAIRAAKGE